MLKDRITKRWAKPSVPFAVEDAEFATDETGRPTLDYKARFSEDEIERRRLGYVCVVCWEAHETPFPEKCKLCGFPMKAKQHEEFERTFQGYERAPRPAMIERELDALDDKHERNFYETKSGIIVPRTLP